MALLGTKFRPPLAAAHVIERPHLLALLERGRRAKLVLISSPAGTGKSTLLAAWLRQRSRPTAWLSLDKTDNNLRQFLLYLVSAAQQLDPVLGADLPDLLQQSAVQVEPLLIRLTNDLAQLGGEATLVLDDYHFLSDPKIHGAVEFLLDHLPPQMCLVIATRTDPPLSLSRLRVGSQLLEIRGADLRFNLAEVTQFLNGSQGLDLSPGVIARLETQTEGWIAALQLAALSLTERPDKEAFIEVFTGSHRFVVDYLVDEVLNRQSVQVKTFLQRVSILERFTTSLCEAVIGQPIGADLLKQLEASNLFLVPLDDERRWYRFHHLFAEFLKSRLEADEAALMPDLHRRASAWFAGEGWINESIQHAFLAADDQLAAQLADDAAAKLALHWNSEQFAHYFQQLPAALLPAHPRLCLYYCWFLTTAKQLGTLKATLPLLEQSKAHFQQPAIIDAAVFGLQAYERLHQLDFASALQLCQQQQRLFGSAELGRSTEAQLVRIGGTNLMATLCLYTAPQQASELFQTSLTLSRQVESAIGIFNSSAGLAQVNHQLGQLHEAARVIQQALLHFESRRNQTAGQLRAENVGELHVRLGRLSYEWNQLDDAEASIQRARTLNELYGSPVVLALELELSFRLSLARGELEAAQTALHRLDQLSASIHRREQLSKRTFEGMAANAKLTLAAQFPQFPHLLDEVTDWLKLRGLGSEDQLGFLPGGHDLRVRLLLARSGSAEALLLLKRLIGAAQAEDRHHDLLHLLLLKGLALHSLNRQGEARQALHHALELAEPEGYCRSFVDLGAAMQVLLRQCAVERPTPYLTALLAAFPQTRQPPQASAPLRTEAEVDRVQGEILPGWSEAFNVREQAVLRLLEVGNTHKQIARELQLSPNTVRWYMKNLYVKLRANNRTEAVNRARDAGLL